MGDPTRVGAHPMSCPCRCLCPDALLQGVWEAGLWRVPQCHPEPAGPLPLPQLSLRPGEWGPGPPTAGIWGRECSEPPWLSCWVVAAGLSLVPCIPVDRRSLCRWTTTAPSTTATSSECPLRWGRGYSHTGVAPPGFGHVPASLPGPLSTPMILHPISSIPRGSPLWSPWQSPVALTVSPVSHRPLVYTVSILLPAAYLVGLFFTLKTHTHIYDIHVSDCHSECPQMSWLQSWLLSLLWGVPHISALFPSAWPPPQRRGPLVPLAGPGHPPALHPVHVSLC